MIDFAKKTAELRATRATLKAASELATSETAGPAKVVAAVATGSLPVVEAESLCAEWEDKAKGWQQMSRGRDPEAQLRVNGMCEALKQCARQLRRRMAAATERQPEENDKILP